MTIEQISKSFSEININDLIQSPTNTPYPVTIFSDPRELEYLYEFDEIVRRPRILLRSPSAYNLHDPELGELVGLSEMFRIDAVRWMAPRSTMRTVPTR